jgi:hypothetical protein
MGKKQYSIAKIKAPEIKGDGKAVRFDVLTEDGETVSLTGVSEINCSEARKATAGAGLVQRGL